MKKRTRVFSLLLAMVLLITAIPVGAMAKGDIVYGVAWITGNNLRLRSSASTSSTTLDSAPEGDVAVVISEQGEWYKVNYNNQIGYMHGDYLDVETKENVELGYGKINANKVNLRKGPGTSYDKVSQGNKGDKAYIIGVNNGWYKVIFGDDICYIRSDYLDLTEIPYENADSKNSPKFFRNGKSTGTKPSASALKGTTGSSSSGSSSSSSSSSGLTGEKIVAKAKKYLGTPYVWNSTDPDVGFDCSGFVYYVYNSLGYKMPRTQSKMYAQGTPVSKKNLQPGDVVFFQNTYKEGISHCGIYVGDSKFIHASSSGDVVKISSLDTNYYIEHYYGAARFV